jgi:hypothetical protein
VSPRRSVFSPEDEDAEADARAACGVHAAGWY